MDKCGVILSRFCSFFSGAVFPLCKNSIALFSIIGVNRYKYKKNKRKFMCEFEDKKLDKRYPPFSQALLLTKTLNKI
tara:strand:+ start:879 stop:1109 length:231 start_codon:yes stop_codon:yes gene_type:complete